MKRAEAWKTYWRAFLEQERGRRTVKWGRRLFLAAVIGFLAYQLTRIGWGEIITSLPTNPLFYLCFIPIYLALPVSETLIYQTVWGVPFLEGFPAFLKKRVLNKDVLGYSGEVYIYLWGKRHVARPDREILSTIKDNTIVSSVASTLFAVLVLSVLFFAGQIKMVEHLADHELAYLIAAVLLGTVVLALGVRFRKNLFVLRGRVLLVLFTIHLLRLILVNLLQIFQWKVVFPDVAWSVWFTLISVMIVTSRIPFLPARDMIFIGASVELARTLAVSTAGIAGMLLVSSILDKGLNAVLFPLMTYVNRRRGPSGEENEAPPSMKDLPPPRAQDALMNFDRDVGK